MDTLKLISVIPLIVMIPITMIPFVYKHIICVPLCSSPISTSVFSLTGVPYVHQGMGQKLAVSTFPMHGLHQKKSFTFGRTSEKQQIKSFFLRLSYFSFGILWFPLVSLVFLWFPLVSFGFLCFGAGWIFWICLPLLSFLFLWFPLVPFFSKGESIEKKEAVSP